MLKWLVVFLEIPMSSLISQNLTEIKAVIIPVYVTPYFACSLVYKLTASDFILASFWNSTHFIGCSKFIFKRRARLLTTKWYRSNQCLVFSLCSLTDCLKQKGILDKPWCLLCLLHFNFFVIKQFQIRLWHVENVLLKQLTTSVFKLRTTLNASAWDLPI